MKNFSLIISDTAAKDLSEINSYLKNELSYPDSAKLLLKKIRKETSKLKELPFLFPLVADEILAARKIRKLSIDNILIFYILTENEKTVTVIRILHARRDWINLL
ncbi:MAG: type II toxin-antitoxin system RelE/ParE family toxin [Spirochaetes bacterium]|nr:MAG: type II toxin-antitoxin system RelE/ParE family toxin [Spirochaetota bacterium]